ncbi:hypothetical protein [Candidatus Magnetominusculus dajiuhuensis]|uniref:hypothetical protein n=1 Tax=Candidatus Magnetominusculus dajiuhuensis TaxID=3137712 RepID=UPI003B43A0A9
MNISLLMAIVAMLYGLICIFIPGLIVQFSIPHNNEALDDNKIAEKTAGNFKWHVPTGIIAGFGIAFLSYLLYIGFSHKAALYIFVVPYLLLFNAKARKRFLRFSQSLYLRFVDSKTINIVVLCTCFGILLVYCTLFWAYFGNGPTYQNVHPTGQTSFMVSYAQSFPPKNISVSGLSVPLNYNGLCHMIGVNFCAIFRMSAHEFMFTYYYFVMVPLYFISILSLFNNLKIRSHYVLYGLPILLFGGEYLIEGIPWFDMFQLQIYHPSFLGHLILYNFLSLVIISRDLKNNVVKYTSIAAAAFLLVGARLPAAIAVFGGTILFTIFYCRSMGERMRWKTLLTVLFFIIFGYAVFFLYGNDKLFVASTPADTPFYYSFCYLYQCDTLPSRIKAHYIDSIGNVGIKSLLLSYMGLVYWPFSMLLHAFYLVPIYPLLMEKFRQRTAVRSEYLLAGIVAFTYLYAAFIKIGEREILTVMDYGFYCSILLFLMQIQDIRLFESLRKGGVLSYQSSTHAQTHPMPGAYIKNRAILLIIVCTIVIVPLSNMIKKFRYQVRNPKSEAASTLWAESKIWPAWQYLFDNCTKDYYNYIDRDMYNALSFIRDNTSKDTVVAAPHFIRPRSEYSFFITAFTERRAYIENRYVGIGLDQKEFRKRRLALWRLINEGRLDISFNADKYVFMLAKDEFEKLSHKRLTRLLYSNGNWAVLELI